MSHNKKIKILIFLILMLIPVKTLAFTLSLNCSKAKIAPGGTATCIITGTKEEEENITNLALSFSSTNEAITKTSFTAESGWNGDFSSLTPPSGLSNEFTVGTIVVTAASDITSGGTISISYGGSADATKTFSLASTISTLDNIIIKDENDNTIKNITCIEGTTTYSYEIEDNDDIYKKIKIYVSTTAKDNSATVNGSQLGEKSIGYGEQTFSILVTSEAETSTTYTLVITKVDNRSNNKDLINFNFNNEDYVLNFSSSTDSYFIDVENNISKIALCPSNYENDDILCINYTDLSYSDDATIELIYNLADINFPTTLTEIQEIGTINVGNNTLLVRITAENESMKTYTFNINRKDLNGNKIDNTDQEVGSNVGTGDAAIVVVIILLVTSLGVIAYIYRDKIFAKFKKKS